MIKENKNPTNVKINSHLLGELAALKINIGASDAEITPPTLGDLTQQLRKKLGEKPEALALSTPRWIASTPSFEAYRRYSEAFELQQMNGDDRGSLLLLREALRIDPEFAEAWALKMFAHWHLGEGDSADAALTEILHHSGRLTEDGNLFYQGLHDARRGDLEGADAKYRELIRRGYQLSSSLGNHGSILWEAGRYEEALEHYRQAAHVSPFVSDDQHSAVSHQLGKLPQAQTAEN